MVRTTAAEQAARLRPPDRMRLTIQGRSVPLNDQFEKALAPPEMLGRKPLRDTFTTLHLSGHMDFEADVLDRTGLPQDMDVTVAIHGASMRPRFFDYDLEQVSGTARFANQQVALSDVRARHGSGILNLKSGVVLLKPNGGYQVRLVNLEDPPLAGAGLIPDDEFIHALPPGGLRKGLESLRLQGPFDLGASLVVTVSEPGMAPDIWWDGSARLTHAALNTGVDLKDVQGVVACNGFYSNQQIDALNGNILLDQVSVLGQPLRNVHTQLEVKRGAPDVLHFYNLSADLFGGTVGGQGFLRFGSAFRYELFLKGLQLQLEQFGRHNFGSSADLQGPALAGLYISGDASGVSGLKGSGQIEVKNGKMYRLPMLLDLLKAFGLRVPDKTAFEQAKVGFEIDGPQARITELELVGNAFSLSGQGTLNLDGSNLNLDFTATWGRLRQVMPWGFSELSRLASAQLLKMKVRGKVGDVKFEKELVPGVVDPVKKVFGKG